MVRECHIHKRRDCYSNPVGGFDRPLQNREKMVVVWELAGPHAVGEEFNMEEAMRRLMTAIAFVFLVAGGTAVAQTQVTTEYYVVQDASTKKCTIVDKKPTTTTTTVVGDGVYKTRTEAETAMKTVKICTN